jgi:site-specific recombinase XerD
MSDQQKHKIQLTASEINRQTSQISESTQRLIQRATDTLTGDLAKSTREAYALDWANFIEFTDQLAQPYLAASTEVFVLYLQSMIDANLAMNTIRRRVAAIRYYHFENNYPSPTDNVLAKKMLRATTRQVGNYVRQTQALLSDDLKRVVDHMDISHLTGLRDRSMILLGFAGAFRRSEVMGLRYENLFFMGNNLRIHLVKSKTDQEQAGLDKPILAEVDSPYCPVNALREWLKASQIRRGYLYRRIRRGHCLDIKQNKPLSSVAYVNCLKKHCKAIGMDTEFIAGHSLRSGFVTSAALQGQDALHIAEVTKQDIRTVQKYMRKAKMFEQHAGEKLLGK